MDVLKGILPSSLNVTKETLKDLMLLLGVETPIEDLNSCECGFRKEIDNDNRFCEIYVYSLVFKEKSNFLKFILGCFFYSDGTLTINSFYFLDNKFIENRPDILDLYAVGILIPSNEVEAK